MKGKTDSVSAANILGASKLVRRFASKIAEAAAGAPILDVACGSGRNAILLSELGCNIVCIDRDLVPLKTRLLTRDSRPLSLNRLHLYQLDLLKDPWPFAEGTAGGIINVHFLLPALFPYFESSLKPGGYLLLESVPAHGGNYLELPPMGAVKSSLAKAFEFEFYRERKTGPLGFDAVTVNMLAMRSIVRSNCRQG